MNPFIAPNDEHCSHSSPLNPCKRKEHENYYTPVDNAQVEFDNYKRFLHDFSNIPKRHSVLFHGETGCGKTSLMYRCLKLLGETNWKINGDVLEPYVIDLSLENINTLSAEQKVDTIIDLIHTNLDEKQIAPDLYEKFGEQLGKDNNIVLRFLENKMKIYKRLLIILFPKISTTEDLKQFMIYFYRSNWVLYFESDNRGIVQYCQSYYKQSGSSPIKCLQVNPLRKTDGELFVNKRLSLVSDQKSGVNFQIKDLEKYLEFAQNRGVSIREFEYICGKAYDKALTSNKEVIVFEDIAQAAISEFQFGGTN